MSNGVVLKCENAERWFSALGQQLSERYRVTHTDTRNGGFHLGTIYFKDAVYYLALFVVEYSGEYVVTLCEREGAKRRLRKAWSIVDTRHIPTRKQMKFCERCLFVHANVEDKCRPVEATQLIWNDVSLTSEDELFASLSRRIIDGVDRELDDFLTIC